MASVRIVITVGDKTYDHEQEVLDTTTGTEYRALIVLDKMVKDLKMVIQPDRQ